MRHEASTSSTLTCESPPPSFLVAQACLVVYLYGGLVANTNADHQLLAHAACETLGKYSGLVANVGDAKRRWCRTGFPSDAKI